MHVLLFTTAAPLAGISQAPRAARRTSHVCKRYVVSAIDINKTTDANREDEIAAKIASLRKQKRLKSGSSSSLPENGTTTESTHTSKPVGPSPQSPPSFGDDNATKQSVFNQLPDWKKEEVLQQQITDAENFFNPSASPPPFPTPNASSALKPIENDKKEPYKPKVSTWGVFPRPDNISKTFGGGKKIQPGGVDLHSDDSKKRDSEIAQKIAKYRASRGIDMQKEEENRERIEEALETADKQMRRSAPYDAIAALESVSNVVSDRSRLGGEVLLSLALAYEAVGRREAARDLYTRLRRSAYSDISSKAKQLLQGFSAMQQLGITDDSENNGLRVASFVLPDVNSIVDKRYETVVLNDMNKTAEPISASTNLLLIALILSPMLFLVFLVLSTQH